MTLTFKEPGRIMCSVKSSPSKHG